MIQQTKTSDIDSIACDWIARRDRGLSPQESADLLAWLATNAHAQAFAERESTWKAMDRASASLPQATLEALARPRTTRLRPAVLWISAATAAAAAVALVFIQQEQIPAERATRAIQTYASPADAESRVPLPDGSIAILHRGSRIAFGAFSSGRRVRLLEGEAHFTVSKATANPFYVHAATVTVRDIGTAFNVRLDPARVSVLVTEGSVEVRNDAIASSQAGDPSPPPVRLTLGEQAVIETNASIPVPEMSAPAPAEVEQVMAWKSRRIRFERTSLASAVEELNRYNVRQLSIGDPSLATILIGGGVRSDDLDAFVGLLESGFGVVAEARGNELILRKAR